MKKHFYIFASSILILVAISTKVYAFTELWRNSKMILPGIEYLRINYSDETRTIPVYVVINHNNSQYHVEPRLAWDRVGRNESPVSYATRTGVPVVINAGYYDIGNTNLPIGHLRFNSRTLSNQKFNRGMLGIDTKGKLYYARQPTSFKLRLLNSTNQEIEIDSFNEPRMQDKNIFFTHEWGESTGTNNFGLELVFERLSPISSFGTTELLLGDKYILTKASNSNTSIPFNGGVLSIHYTKLRNYSWLRDVNLGSIFQIESNLSRIWANLPFIIGGGPLLMLDGQSVLNYSAEKFNPYYNKQHPRTIVATRNDGATLFIIVDGRNEFLQGITLEEAVIICRNLNAIHAINFDGGGSSCLVIQNEVMNVPSDGKPRSVANFLVLTK